MKWLVVLLSFAAGHCIAAPSVSSHTSDCSTIGNTVVLTGTGFSADGGEVPVVFDDFESGTDGNNLSTGGIWSTTSQNGPADPVYDNTLKYSGSLSGYCDFLSTGGDCLAYKQHNYGLEIYASFRFRYNQTVDGSTSKGFRAHADASNVYGETGQSIYTSYPQIITQDYHPTSRGGDNNRTTVNKGTAANGSESDGSPGSLSEDTWYRLEYYYQHSTTANATDGKAHTWKDGVQEGDWDIGDKSGITRDNTRTFQVALMPFYMSNGMRGELWYDDAYISKTRARVEICDSATWASCTSDKVIQNPSAWSNTEITFAVTQGVENITNRYLYVVDSSGAVSASYDCSSGTPETPPEPSHQLGNRGSKWTGFAFIALGLAALGAVVGFRPHDRLSSY